jgi:hypothetical protein
MSIWSLFINLLFNPYGQRHVLWSNFINAYKREYKQLCDAYDKDFERRMDEGAKFLKIH